MATLNPNLKSFWKARENEDGDPVIGRVLYGGRMSSKSHDMAGVAIARANHHPERFLCTRMFQNRIADSVYTLLKDKIYYFGLEGNFKIYADAIEHKYNESLFRFYGIARNIDEIKSFEGATVWWNEESHNLTEEMFTIIRPTIMRNAGAEMWFTLNPRLDSDYSYKRLIKSPPKGFLVRKINYDENGFLGEQALRDIAAEFEEDPELADHIYNGTPRTDDDSVVIKRSWILAAIDAHLQCKSMQGVKTVGYDVADSGQDKNAAVFIDGAICEAIDEWKAGDDELFKSTKRVKSFAEKHGASFIGYDSIGVGAGVGANLNELKFRHHYKFNAGSKVLNPKKKYGETKIANDEFFSNLKAQMWWMLADRFRNTFNAIHKSEKFAPDEMISISSAINPKVLDKLIDELSTPRRDFDNQGRVKVESKKDLAKRDVVSPNIADAFIIAFSRGMLARKSISEMM